MPRGDRHEFAEHARFRGLVSTRFEVQEGRQMPLDRGLQGQRVKWQIAEEIKRGRFQICLPKSTKI